MTSTLAISRSDTIQRTRKPVIVLRNVTKTYVMGEVEVQSLRGISLSIERGDFVAIMGPSGSGKSTTMNIIGCLDVPSRGRYWLDGVDVRTLEDADLSKIRNQKIGFIFQSFNLIPRISALANVELALAYRGVKAKERRVRATEALQATGVGDRLTHMPSELSGGEQQRVAVARAIATNPSIVLADEPTGNLATVQSAEIMAIFSRLNAEGRTIVLITHEEDIALYAKRIIRIRDGMVIEDYRRYPINALPPHLDSVPHIGAASGGIATAQPGDATIRISRRQEYGGTVGLLTTDLPQGMHTQDDLLRGDAE
ncbi:MAG: ABC transporter ATP-binding protein [Acidimicrobiales bacterium]